MMRQINPDESRVQLSAAVVGRWPASCGWPLADDPVLTGCLVKLEEDIKLPAPEAGVLVQLSVKEGSQVRQGEVIGKIDDDEAQMQEAGRRIRLGARVQAATDDVQIRLCRKVGRRRRKELSR